QPAKQKSVERGFVGLFVGYQTQEEPGGAKATRVYRIHYLDDVLSEPPPGRPRVSAVRLYDELHWFEVGEPDRNNRKPRATLPCEPAEGYPRPWRKVKIEATTHSLRVSCDHRGKTMTCFGDFTEADLNQQTQSQLAFLRKNPASGLARLRLDNFHPHQGIGVFAHNCTASFRNVVIEPLP